MRCLIALAAVVVVLIAIPAAALPDYAVHITYFDENGNEIGTYDAVCYSGYYFSGQTSDSYTLEIWEACNDLAPITCADFGESELPGCTGINWCVSGSYAWDYDHGFVPNCQGDYVKQRLGRNQVRRSIMRRAAQSLPGRYGVPPASVWTSRAKNGAPGGRFLEEKPSFSLQRWHTYLGGLRD
jgi:hypothetical protein